MKRTGWWHSSSARAAGRVVAGAKVLAVILVFASGPALAHDPSKHRAAAIHGSVVLASRDALTIEQDDKETTFSISPETKVMRDGASVPIGDVKPGAPVAVFATKLPDGKTVASEVNLVDRASAEAPRGQGRRHGGADGPAK